MKILLTTLNSKFIHSNLALKYLYSVVAPAYVDVEVKEFTINNEPSYVYGEILRGDYDMVCFSCYIWNIEQTVRLCEKLRKAEPEMIITFGGPEVSYDYVEFLQNHKFLDVIIRGEGEYPFYRLCKAMLTGDKDISQIPGLAYRQGGKIFVNEDQEVADFERIPFPYKTMEVEDDKIIYYESSRGCPFRCSYCLSSIDKSIRALPLDRVRSDLGYFLYKKVKQVKFIDRTFNFDRERAYEIFKFLIENDNGVTNFHMEMCGDLLDEKTLQLLAKARKGLFQFEIGIQTTNPMTLAAVNRNENVYPVLFNVKKLLEMGNIHIHVDLIAGLPYEDYKSFERSFNKVYALGADNLQLGFLKLLKGTKIRLEEDKYQYQYEDHAPYQVISNKFISAREIVRLKMIEEVLDLYKNRGGFDRTLDYYLDEKGMEPFAFFQMLADYYYDNGFQHASHKKEDLYRILYKMVWDQNQDQPVELAKIQGLLMEDMDHTLNFDAVKRFIKKGWEI